MSLVHFELPEDIATQVHSLLRSFGKELNDAANALNDDRRRKWMAATQRFMSTGVVPDGYIRMSRGRMTWLEPIAARPSGAEIATKRGIYVAMIKIALRHPADEIRRELEAVGFRRGRPRRKGPAAPKERNRNRRRVIHPYRYP